MAMVNVVETDYHYNQREGTGKKTGKDFLN